MANFFRDFAWAAFIIALFVIGFMIGTKIASADLTRAKAAKGFSANYWSIERVLILPLKGYTRVYFRIYKDRATFLADPDNYIMTDVKQLSGLQFKSRSALLDTVKAQDSELSTAVKD